MRPMLSGLLDDSHDRPRARILEMYAVLLVLNLGAWCWALIAFHRYPVLLGTALLAYSLGLRHAVDADHLAAIDNVTRKLMQEGKKPVAVGFMFSLGHSTVVILGSIAIVLAASALHTRIGAVREIGGLVGTGISAGFLFAIALANVMVLRSVYRALLRRRAGDASAADGADDTDDADLLPRNRGLLARLYRPMFRLVTRSWHMYPLGVLFGLGFDTATEIGVLGISAVEASKGLPLSSIMVFPLLFTAGMALVDTSDGILMLGAYGWAYDQPLRKLYYNLTVTLLSVVIALVIGGIEVLGMMAHLESGGQLWRVIGTLNDRFGLAGYFIIGLFLLCWALSIAIQRFRRVGESP
ncbi:HoxN/HupN/NixA family nickel/cobalt transporter [Cupriavidus sp. YAF13]|uniref:HoxN/HupN/NixA family nickel/cobalt transporter n=1 Tax=Cupriavidus sp. YAF13 TaxID=3233075 RepID=UPI003F91A9F8